MTLTVLISITGHLVVATFFNHSFCIPFVFSKHLDGHDSLPSGMTQTFIPEGSGPLAILPPLDFCSFPSTVITGHGNTKTP